MVCQKCHAEIPEGYLYCPVCGEEIIIVNDFDITLEDNIDVGALADTAEMPRIKRRITDDRPTKEIEIPQIISEEPEDISVKKSKKHRHWIIACSIGLIVIGLVIYCAITISNYFSYDKQFAYAQNAYDLGDYALAVEKAKHAVQLSENNEGASYLLADSFFAQDNYDAANAVWFDLLSRFPDRIELYDNIVACYEKEGDVEAVHKLLENSNDDVLKERYHEFLACEPEFSMESGNFNNPDPVILSAPEDCIIYYTDDGTIPDDTSKEYTGPIELNEGITQITAVVKNKKGVIGAPVTKTYEVELKSPAPDAPQLKLASGTYSEPGLIEIENIPENVKVFFTNDGKMPSVNSYDYSMPILMPIGTSKYKFIAVNDEGTTSEVTQAEYSLNLNALIDTSVAEYAISYHLLEMGEDVSLNTYQVKKAYSEAGKIFYVVEEYTGNKKTGRMFAVDIISGELYKLLKDQDNMAYHISAL